MRDAFIASLTQLAENDDRIELIVGDLGFGVVTDFAERFPDRFLNVGVAEQNMIGVATGLALTGSIVFAYSIANFSTIRCLEQIRNDALYHDANVKIVAVGGGLAYGSLGMSHHATEDLAIMRSLPGMVVAAPGDPAEAAAATQEIAALEGTAYLRLGKTGEPHIHNLQPRIPPGTSVLVRDGDDISLIVTGGLLGVAVEAARELESRGIRVRLVSMPWIAPFDTTTAQRCSNETRLVVTLEEHSVNGGLGGATAEAITDAGSPARLLRLGVPTDRNSLVGSQNYLRSIYGLDVRSVIDRIEKALADVMRP